MFFESRQWIVCSSSSFPHNFSQKQKQVSTVKPTTAILQSHPITNMILPLYLQALLHGNTISIVQDNAKSHADMLLSTGSSDTTTTTQTTTGLVVIIGNCKAKHHLVESSLPDCKTENKKFSRWESEPSSSAPVQSIKECYNNKNNQGPRLVVSRDRAPVLKRRQSDNDANCLNIVAAAA